MDEDIFDQLPVLDSMVKK